jgi:hypothetical protein
MSLNDVLFWTIKVKTMIKDHRDLDLIVLERRDFPDGGESISSWVYFSVGGNEEDLALRPLAAKITREDS